MNEPSDKAILRATLLAARRAMPAERRAEADAALVAAAVAAIAAASPAVVCGYAPMAGEPGGAGLLPALAAAVPTLLLPVLMADRDLDWAAYAGPGALART